MRFENEEMFELSSWKFECRESQPYNEAQLIIYRKKFE